MAELSLSLRLGGWLRGPPEQTLPTPPSPSCTQLPSWTGCPRDGSALARSALLQKQPAKELLDSREASRRTLSPAGRHVETDLHPQSRPRDPQHRICLIDRVRMDALADQAT